MRARVSRLVGSLRVLNVSHGAEFTFRAKTEMECMGRGGSGKA